MYNFSWNIFILNSTRIQFLLSIESIFNYQIFLFPETRDIRDRYPAKMFQRERVEFCRPKGGDVQIRFD